MRKQLSGVVRYRLALSAVAAFVSLSAATGQAQEPAAPAQPSAPGPRLTVEPAEVNLGQVYWGDTVRGQVMLRNTGTEPLQIARIESTCGCTAATLRDQDKLIAPGASVPLGVSMHPKNEQTPLVKYLKVYSNDSSHPMTQIKVSSDVLVGVAVDPSFVLFKDLDVGETRSMTVTVSSRDGEEITIQDVTFSHGIYKAEFDRTARGTQHQITVTTGPIEDTRYPASKMTVRTTHSKTPEMSVNANSMLRPAVTRSANMLNFGEVSPGAPAVASMELTDSRTGEAVKSVRAQLPKYPDIRIEARADETNPKLWRFTAHVPEAHAGQKISTPIRLDTNVRRSEPVMMMCALIVKGGSSASTPAARAPAASSTSAPAAAPTSSSSAE